MEALEKLKKERKRNQRDFLNRPFSPNVILFEGNNLQKLPKFGNESVLNFIY